MKKTFWVEFYPTNSDLKEVWENSIIVFDTNSLLNLYRYSKKTKGQYLSVLEQFKDRLWLPYQACSEYFKNRPSVIISMENEYLNLKKRVETQNEDFNTAMNKAFKYDEDDTKSLILEAEKSFKKIIKAIDESKKNRIPFSCHTDPVLDKFKVLFEDKVGEPFSPEELEDVIKEGEERYAKKTPPGYCDERKNDVEQNKFGDLIIWKQIIKKSSTDKKNVIFVTDDRKEDWWLIVHGKTISPRKELYEEFFLNTKQKILIYTPNQFLKYAKDEMQSKVDDNSLREIINIGAQKFFVCEHPNNLWNTNKNSDHVSSDYLKYYNEVLNPNVANYLDVNSIPNNMPPNYFKFSQKSNVANYLDVNSIPNNMPPDYLKFLQKPNDTSNLSDNGDLDKKQY